LKFVYVASESLFGYVHAGARLLAEFLYHI
jgi:hypothetical protein